MKKRILIADDHPVVLEGLEIILQHEGYETIKATGVEEAISISKNSGKFDLMVIDLTLKEDADGLSLIKKLRNAGATAPAVVYTMHEELWNISLLNDADVEGIVLKGESVDELIEAIRTVGEGGRYRSPIFRNRIASLKSYKGNLSAKETNIINLIGRGDSTGEIADKMCISVKAVEYHRGNIMKKLESKNMTEAIKNAVKLGIISSVTAFASMTAYSQEPVAPKVVDMGVSVKWADCNLGAVSPLEPGGFYAFAETSEKEIYNWSTYSLCKDGSMFTQSYIGDESICSTEYDAAHQILGEGWRLPTIDEYEELAENCCLEFFDANEEHLAFARLTSSNGNYIEIPLAGYKNNDKHQYENKQAVMHTGTFEVESGEEDGFTYCLNSPFNIAFVAGSNPIVINGSSHLGLPIRPVYDAANSAGTNMASDEIISIYSIDGRYISGDMATLPGGIYIIRHSDGSTKKIIISR